MDDIAQAIFADFYIFRQLINKTGTNYMIAGLNVHKFSWVGLWQLSLAPKITGPCCSGGP